MCFQIPLKISGGLFVAERNIGFNAPRSVGLCRRNSSGIVMIKSFLYIPGKSCVEAIRTGLAGENIDVISHHKNSWMACRGEVASFTVNSPASFCEQNFAAAVFVARPTRNEDWRHEAEPPARFTAAMQCVRSANSTAWRRGGDSNPRYLLGTHAFQACSLNHSDTPPQFERENLSLPCGEINGRGGLILLLSNSKPCPYCSRCVVSVS